MKNCEHGDRLKINELITKNKELIDIIKELQSRKNYGLVWEEKTEEIEEKYKNNLPVLQLYNRYSNNFTYSEDKNNHLLIEGDNLEGLLALQLTHRESVDIIYIDPPYNTGKDDFIYNDSYVCETDSYRHSKWLGFISKRLKLAKQLLKDTGLIFISIDEYEFAQLKLLCDSIFYESNFIENFIWIKNSTKNNSLIHSCNHEYILCYSKNKANILNGKYFKIEKEGYEEIISFYDQCLKDSLSHKEIESKLADFYKNGHFEKNIKSFKYVDSKGIYSSGDAGSPSMPKNNGNYYDIYHPVTKLPCKKPDKGWRFSNTKMQTLLSEDYIIFGKDENTVPRVKRYLTELEVEVMKSVINNNIDGFKDLQAILPGNKFNNPKPISLIKSLLKANPHKDITVLDFFAGSGTTGQAVMELNEEDGGSRKFILLTNNEVNK